VIWSSPKAPTPGHEELNAGAQKLIDRTPDFVFTAAGPAHVLRDLGYLAITYVNPAEGIWSLLKRSIANFAAADVDGLVRIIKRKLKKIQYWPHLIDGCLAGTGLKIEPW
jgi:hypothetical protein